MYNKIDNEKAKMAIEDKGCEDIWTTRQYQSVGSLSGRAQPWRGAEDNDDDPSNKSKYKRKTNLVHIMKLKGVFSSSGSIKGSQPQYAFVYCQF